MKMSIVTEPRNNKFGRPRYVARWQYGRARGKEFGVTRSDAMRRAIAAMRGAQ